jgi:tetratricopeptide (TPR) repeat protein
MNVALVVLTGSVAAVLGFLEGRALARREAARLADALRAEAAAARDEASRLLAERDAEVAREREAAAALAAELEAARGEVSRRRRWAEDQFRQLLGDFQAAWAAARLPTQLHELQGHPADGERAHLEGLATRLRAWMEELGGGSPELHFQLGLCAVLGSRFREASDHFQEAAHRGLGADAWLALGDALWAQERTDRARLAYKNCLHLPGIPVHALMRYARACAERREYREAAVALDRLLERPDTPREAFALASLAYGKLQQNEKSVQACEAGLARLADDPVAAAELHAKSIIPLFRLGQQERAEAAYLRALELHPKCAEAPFSIGVAHLHQGDVKGAIPFLRDAVELDKRYPQAYFCLGVAHNKLSQFKKALQYFTKAVEIDPEYAEAYLHMKDSYEGIRDFDKAVAMLRKATLLSQEYR